MINIEGPPERFREPKVSGELLSASGSNLFRMYFLMDLVEVKSIVIFFWGVPPAADLEDARLGVAAGGMI